MATFVVILIDFNFCALSSQQPAAAPDRDKDELQDRERFPLQLHICLNFIY